MLDIVDSAGQEQGRRPKGSELKILLGFTGRCHSLLANIPSENGVLAFHQKLQIIRVLGVSDADENTKEG